MIHIKCFFLFLMCCLLCFCSEKTKISNNIDFKDFSIKRKTNFSINQIGKIEKVIPLQTTDESVFGMAKTIFCSKNGDFFVCDTDNAKKILRFNNHGTFIKEYGVIGMGPGEHVHLMGADLASDDSLVILSDSKLIKFDPTGKLMAELRMNKEKGLDIAIINDLIYVPIFISTDPVQNNHAILIFDMNLKPAGSIGSYDKRIDLIRNTPIKLCSKGNNKFYFVDYFDYKLNIYDTQSQTLSVLFDAEKNTGIHSIWSKSVLTDEDVNMVKRNMYRFEKVYIFDHVTLMTESCQEKEIFDYCFLDLEKKEMIVYPYVEMDILTRIFFFRIVGVEKNRAIILFGSEFMEEVPNLKKTFPELKNLEINMEDNPVLILFSFNDCR